MALRFGIFLGPFHPPSHNLAWAIERDLQLVEQLDRLGFDEVWFGEHHSGGFEITPSPEIMVAAAAQRTSRITLCSGVISLPYHHPLMVADRIAFLDHMTRGRFVAGFGPGALPADSLMMGIDYTELRPRMEESLEAVLALLDGGEPIDRKTEWFELREARLQLTSYTRPRVPIAVAAAVSPTGPSLAGRYGLGLVSFAAGSEAGFRALESTWSVMEDQAERHGQTVSRSDWALVAMMHVAPTEEQARAEVRHGLGHYFDYLHTSSFVPLWDPDDEPSHDEKVDAINASGVGVIGTPEMAVDYLRRFERQTGGFGAFLFFASEWADREAQYRNYELFAREVAPHFDDRPDTRGESFRWKLEHKGMLKERMAAGIEAARARHAEAMRLADPPA